MLRHMRTTIRLDDRLLAEAKAFAARTGRTLTSVIEDALRRLMAPEKGAQRSRVRLPVSSQKGGLREGVDLDDSAALLDLMESEE